jgi:hypothetical protein
MPEANPFLIFLEQFEKSNLPYMVTGSVASIIYGEPRMTHDIDIVLELCIESVHDFLSLFPSDEFYCPPKEVVRTEIARETRGHFNIIHHNTGFKADIYPVGQDQLHKWAMVNRKKILFSGIHIWVAPPEYVIVRKLEYYKEGGSSKHIRDIRKMIDLSGSTIDMKQLNYWLAMYKLSDQWKLVDAFK